MIDLALEGETRTWQQLRAHYTVERALAERLRHASKSERAHLYTDLYNELYQRVPAHPQLVRKASDSDSAHAIQTQMALLKAFLHPAASFLEIGPGDCALSLFLTSQVAQVYAVDVSDEITKVQQTPSNFHLFISDGSSVPVAEASIDVAYSNQLMEHLHPDDAVEQLKNIYAVLKPSGVYVCITPNRLSGPHDISKFFSVQATGFHLKEYTTQELVALFAQVGFRRIKVYGSVKQWVFGVPLSVISTLEWLLVRIPFRWRRRLVRQAPLRWLLGIQIAGFKA